MITCTLRYVIDPKQVLAFENYGKVWISLVNRMGGIHHGYFLPHEGANNIAFALFSFPSLAEYETYRSRIAEDSDCQKVMKLAAETNCILSYERSFTRPVLEGSLEPIT
ncbi:MAG: NIPSNAP family protein [Rhizobiaceae bacterium]